jgi:hypothetical protein
MRGLFRGLCALLPALLAPACREQAPEPPPAQAAAPPPDWAAHLCEDWVQLDGSCDLARITADYEECLRTQGAPTTLALRERGVGNRQSLRAGERKTNLCLELRKWRMTPRGLEKWQGGRRRATAPS